MKSRRFDLVRVGDLVLPVDSHEFLFSTPEKVEDEEDPIDMIWSDDTPGLVVEVRYFDPYRDYYQVKVVVDEVVGWTFSDYVWLI